MVLEAGVNLDKVVEDLNVTRVGNDHVRIEIGRVWEPATVLEQTKFE